MRMRAASQTPRRMNCDVSGECMLPPCAYAPVSSFVVACCLFAHLFPAGGKTEESSQDPTSVRCCPPPLMREVRTSAAEMRDVLERTTAAPRKMELLSMAACSRLHHCVRADL